MKFTFFEHVIGILMALTMIALSPIIVILAVVKTAWKFIKGGLDAIKDE